MNVVLFVRVSSDLEYEELENRVAERRPKFLEVPGLIPKVYGRGPGTGDWCGIYFFESRDAVVAFRDSELAKGPVTPLADATGAPEPLRSLTW